MTLPCGLDSTRLRPVRDGEFKLLPRTLWTPKTRHCGTAEAALYSGTKDQPGCQCSHIDTRMFVHTDSLTQHTDTHRHTLELLIHITFTSTAHLGIVMDSFRCAIFFFRRWPGGSLFILNGLHGPSMPKNQHRNSLPMDPKSRESRARLTPGLLNILLSLNQETACGALMLSFALFFFF